MALQQFLEYLHNCITTNTFIKISFGNYIGADTQLKQIFVKPIAIKSVLHYQFTYRYKTNDVAKNYTPDEAFSLITKNADVEFGITTLFSNAAEIILETLKNNKKRIRIIEKTARIESSLFQNDKIKNRNITDTNATYLHLLGITDIQGNVLKASQDKYKQINHYIEILSSLFQKMDIASSLQIVDMGCGKGYLTFALYDYLKNNLQKNVEIIGVENRADLVAKCNSYAHQSNFTNLYFVENNIAQYDASKANVLIALHACDTATDDAIAKGIQAKSNLIVVAPCCHKQIRKEIEINKAKNSFEYITKHGIMLERTAEMITDSMRALILEYHGYKTKVFEFITNIHTPKNIMIVAEKGTINNENQIKILSQLNAAKVEFGITHHYLETLLFGSRLI
jgi:SAM-dependent methyltransferase